MGADVSCVRRLGGRSKEMAARRVANDDDTPRHTQLTSNARHKLEHLQSSSRAVAHNTPKAAVAHNTPVLQNKVSKSIVKQMILDGKRKGAIEDRLLEAAQRNKEKLAQAEGAKLAETERDLASSRATQALDLSMASVADDAAGGKDSSETLAKRAMAASHRLFQLSFAREDKILHLQSEALEKEREWCSQADAARTPSRYVSLRRGSLSPPKTPSSRPGLSTPKGMGHTLHAIQDGRWASFQEVEHHFMKSLRTVAPFHLAAPSDGKTMHALDYCDARADTAVAAPAPPLSEVPSACCGFLATLCCRGACTHTHTHTYVGT